MMSRALRQVRTTSSTTRNFHHRHRHRSAAQADIVINIFVRFIIFHPDFVCIRFELPLHCSCSPVSSRPPDMQTSKIHNPPTTPMDSHVYICLFRVGIYTGIAILCFAPQKRDGLFETINTGVAIHSVYALPVPVRGTT